MKISDKKKIEELEKRIRELEQRPIYPQYPYYPYAPPTTPYPTQNCPYCGLPPAWCRGHIIC